MKDYYNILGVNKNSSPDEIKKAYRKLSKQFHPDVNPEGGDKFKEIAEAYDILSDPVKKQQYDNPNPFGGTNGFSGFDDFFDLFNRGQQRRAPKAPDKILNVEVTSLESFKGVEKEISYRAKEMCNTCVGQGGDKKVCSVCSGRGSIQQRVGTAMFSQIIETPCNSCNGSGYQIHNPCHSCNGHGTKDKIESIKVNIPKSVDDGDFLRVPSKGDFYSNMGVVGDLIIKVIMKPIDGFEKNGYNLIYNTILSPLDLIIKRDLDIPHPDGAIKILLPENIGTDKPLRLKGKGYTINGQIGDMYLKISIKRDLVSDEDISKVKELFEKS
jgi:molecular chaperone DnaJ